MTAGVLQVRGTGCRCHAAPGAPFEPGWHRWPAPAGTPRIVVGGAGLAGLSAAYRLRTAGYLSTVVEASDRIGGRCWSIKGYFNDGQVAEHGGELIDQGHTEVRQLAQSLGLSLDNLLSAEASGTEAIYYFDGAPYTYAEATNDIKAIWQQLHSDVSAASYPTLYNSFTQRGLELDRMSIATWISTNVPGGAKSRLGQLLDVAYNIEYGAETSVRSGPGWSPSRTTRTARGPSPPRRGTGPRAGSPTTSYSLCRSRCCARST